jgi:hypothetical protein
LRFEPLYRQWRASAADAKVIIIIIVTGKVGASSGRAYKVPPHVNSQGGGDFPDTEQKVPWRKLQSRRIDCRSGKSRALAGRRPLSYISPIFKGTVGAGREFAEKQAHHRRRRLKGSQECDEVLFLVPGELRTKDQVEELDRVVQR